MELIQKEEGELVTRKAQLERQLAHRELTASQEDRIKSLAQQLSTGLNNLDFHGRQEIIRLLVEKVVYDGSNVEIQTIIHTNEQLYPTHRGGYRG